MTNDFLEDLQWRGLVRDCTDLTALAQALTAGPVTLYCGFDPTAKSLHVGSLIPLVTLKRFQQAGHRAIALVGGATGLIGDPSGKSTERVLQTPDQVRDQGKAIQDQIAPFTNGLVRDNLDWTQGLSLLTFLRDIGKHFSVNTMMARDSVSSRLEREGEGISFTEFSYMLLQSFDFLKLFELENCTLQIGGSDQWGNMCSGVDLVRRVHAKTALAMTLPLLTTAEGKKFGKTEKGAVWLSADQTSPWEFFQFWLNTADADVVRLLKLFTFLPRAEIEALDVSTQQTPQARAAQRALAHAMTALIHGAATADQMVAAARVLFSKDEDAGGLSLSTLEALSKATPTFQVSATEVPRLSQILVKTGLETSMTKATQVIADAKAVSVNNRSCTEPGFIPSESDWLHGRFLLIKKGKKSFAFVERLN